MIKNIRLSALVAIFAVTAVIYARVPPPSPARAQFVAQATFGGTSGGSANAQTITIGNMASPVAGVPLTFIAGFSNSGPTTLNVTGSGGVSVLRTSSIGNVQLSGNEIFFGELVTVTFNGSTFQLMNRGPDKIGNTVEYRGGAVLRGTLIEDGSCISQTTYAPLFSVIGTSYGACGAGLFALPDSRGAFFAAADAQGSNGPANRITSGGSGCAATSGALCGLQNRTVLATYLPASGLSVPGLSVPGLSVPGLSVPGLSVPGLSVPSLSVATSTTNVGNIPLSSGAISSLQTQGTATTNITPANTSGTWTGTTSLAGTGTTGASTTGTGTTGTGTTGTSTTGTGTTGTGTTGSMGSGTAMPVLNPVLIGTRAITY